jgi:cytoskeletal protein CcmA (bactofilin family)
MARSSLPLRLPSGLRLDGALAVRGDARIACALKGSLRVEGRLEIAPGAVVDGDVASHSLQIEPGSTVRARLAIGKASAPAQAKVAPLRRFLPAAFFPPALK